MATSDAYQKIQAGIAAARAGKRAEARQLLVEAARQSPNNEQVWLWLAGVMDRPEETIHCLEQALVLNPQNEAARRGIAWARQRLASAPAAPPAQPTAAPSREAGPPAPAPAPPRRPAPPAPETPETLAARLVAGKASLPHWEARGLASLRSLETVDEMVARGKTVLEQGRVDEAADIFRGAISRQPDHAEAHSQLAVALYHQGDKQGALVELEHAIAINPTYTEVHFSLGEIYEELGETKAAVACWERVLQLDPGHTEAKQNLETARKRAPEAPRHRCPNCNAQLSGLEPKCPQCGRELFVRCANCGEYAEEKEEVCPRCGAALRKDQEKARPKSAEKPAEKVAPQEAPGSQIACLYCGNLNPAYHARCAICGQPLGDQPSSGQKKHKQKDAGKMRRPLRRTWQWIGLASWIAGCGLCIWGSYTAVHLAMRTNLDLVDPIHVAGDLMTQNMNASLLTTVALGTALLLTLVGFVGFRRARS